LEDLIDACFGLVQLDEETTTLRFAHSSVKEFVTRSRLSSTPNLLEEGHASIARTCLKYLNSIEFTGSCKTFAELESRIQEHPLLRYAA
ncbi:hypothetical protein L207DRAFT_388100, partial [Hyaloscypha variabilis F]